MLTPRVDYLSLVADLFDSAPAPGQLINSCRLLLLDLVGDRTMYCSFDLAGKQRRMRLNASWPVTAECRAFTAYALPRDSKRYAKYGFQEDLVILDFERDCIKDRDRRRHSRLRMGVNLERLSVRQLELLPQLARAFGEQVAQTHLLASGFYDISDVRQTMLGRHFDGSIISSCDFQRRLNMQLQVRQQNNQGYSAGGVFWGNLLGLQMMEALGSETFLEEYSGCAPETSGLSTEYEDGSALLLLTEDIRKMMYPHASLGDTVLDRAAWLYEQLARRGLMYG